MKISFGMITKDLLTLEPIDQFLDNAEKFNHSVEAVVIGYSDQIDEAIVKEIEARCTLHLVKIRNDLPLNNELKALGMAKEHIHCLVGDIDQPSDGRSAYGQSRNHVIMKAMLEKIEVLIFIDTDVYPEVIIHSKDVIRDDRFYIKPTALDDIFIQEVDFIGRHLEELVDETVMVTTSDYSGYYIIPPMQFEGMRELFYGLKKETAYEYIMNSYHHHCLSPDHGVRRKKFKTHKILGGNVAIKLKLFHEIVPFFSSTFEVEGNKYLTRGEDTVLALQMKTKPHIKFIDIDTKIFHNTYSHFPIVPDIKTDQGIKDRFFYASMGWIGRNPFLNDLSGITKSCAYELEHGHLEVGAKAIAEYLEDERFLVLPRAHDIAYRELNQMKAYFKLFQNSWYEFIRRIR